MTDKIILAATGKCLFGKSIKETLPEIEQTDIDWSAILNECIQQTIPTIVLDGLAELRDSIPHDLYMKWLMISSYIMRNNEKINAEQRDLIKLLNENEIPYIILKGITAAYNYPKPELRLLGDIDFLVKLEDKDRTKQLLLDNGHIEIDNESSYHASFKHNNVHVEMHFEINGIPNGKIGNKIKDHISDIINISNNITVENNSLNMSSVKNQGIVFILHMVSHLLVFGLGLRHLCDWAMFVDKQLTDEVWETHYKQILSDTGLIDITYALTWTCAKYLGLPIKKWMKIEDDDICEGIINDILKSGNFGRKDPARSKVGLLTFNSRENDENDSIIHSINRNIYNLAEHHWPIIKKVPFIIIFAYIYFPIRYLVMMLMNKRPKLTLKKSIKDIEERRNIYKKLNIFKVDKE